MSRKVYENGLSKYISVHGTWSCFLYSLTPFKYEESCFHLTEDSGFTCLVDGGSPIASKQSMADYQVSEPPLGTRTL